MAVYDVHVNDWNRHAPVRGGFEKRDLAVTTDFRDVLGELVRGHLGQRTDTVFPGFAGAKPLGLLAKV